MKTGVSCRKSLAVYFLVVYRRMVISLHLLKSVCKAASAALWTLIQGSCRSAWSPETERITKFSERGKPRLKLCLAVRLHVEAQLYAEPGPMPIGRICICKLRIYFNTDMGQRRSWPCDQYVYRQSENNGLLGMMPAKSWSLGLLYTPEKSQDQGGIRDSNEALWFSVSGLTCNLVQH